MGCANSSTQFQRSVSLSMKKNGSTTYQQKQKSLPITRQSSKSSNDSDSFGKLPETPSTLSASGEEKQLNSSDEGVHLENIKVKEEQPYQADDELEQLQQQEEIEYQQIIKALLSEIEKQIPHKHVSEAYIHARKKCRISRGSRENPAPVINKSLSKSRILKRRDLLIQHVDSLGNQDQNNQ